MVCFSCWKFYIQNCKLFNEFQMFFEISIILEKLQIYKFGEWYVLVTRIYTDI